MKSPLTIGSRWKHPDRNLHCHCFTNGLNPWLKPLRIIFVRLSTDETDNPWTLKRNHLQWSGFSFMQMKQIATYIIYLVRRMERLSDYSPSSAVILGRRIFLSVFWNKFSVSVCIQYMSKQNWLTKYFEIILSKLANTPRFNPLYHKEKAHCDLLHYQFMQSLLLLSAAVFLK